MNAFLTLKSHQRDWRSFLAALLLIAVSGCASSCKKETSIPNIVVPPPAASAFAVPVGNAVVYEVYVRDFSAAGNFDGLTARLDSIKRLGCNVIWLMPVHPIGVAKRIGSLGSPYSVSNYKAVNSEYGTLVSFDRLVAAAHEKKMAVILDWVANHTAWDHDWITSHPDWYTHDSGGAIIPPKGTGWNDVADLNYDKPALRLAMIDGMRFWVKSHSVDGFRCDAADMVPPDFWKQAIDSMRLVRSNLFWLAEATNTNSYTAGFELTYGWEFYPALKQVFVDGNAVSTLTSTHNHEMTGVPAGNYRLRFTTNHDFTVTDGTPQQLYGSQDAANAAYVATIAYGATPLVYNGQDAGDATQLGLFEKATINWDASPATTFFYRRLLTAYDSLPALRTGLIQPIYTSPDVVSVLRTTATQRVAVFVNARNAAKTITIPASWPATTWANALSGEAIPTTTTTLTLPAYGYAIWRSQ